jgi:hypothetical protein
VKTGTAQIIAGRIFGEVQPRHEKPRNIAVEFPQNMLLIRSVESQIVIEKPVHRRRKLAGAANKTARDAEPRHPEDRSAGLRNARREAGSIGRPRSWQKPRNPKPQWPSGCLLQDCIQVATKSLQSSY